MSTDEQTKCSKPVKKKKKKRPRGFAGMIWGQVKLLNESDYFKEKYGQDNLSFLLVATDQRYAAHIIVKDGVVSVDGIPNTKEDLKQVKPSASMRCKFDDFFAIAAGKVKTAGLLAWLITRRLKIKGIKKLMRLLKYFKIIAYINKEKIKQIKEKSKTTGGDQMKVE
ncbi:MAG: hypothetical protein ACTSWN_00695 [Promethearchaeota archaeon]